MLTFGWTNDPKNWPDLEWPEVSDGLFTKNTRYIYKGVYEEQRVPRHKINSAVVEYVEFTFIKRINQVLSCFQQRKLRHLKG